MERREARIRQNTALRRSDERSEGCPIAETSKIVIS